MQGWICKCTKCGNPTITTHRVYEEVMKCGCGGVLKPERECGIGVDLALACNDMTAIPTIKHGNTVIIRSRAMLRSEECERAAKVLQELLQEKTVVIPTKFEIIGEIKNG